MVSLLQNTSEILVPMVSLLGGFLNMFVQTLAYDFNGFLGNSVLVFIALQNSLKFLYLIVSRHQKAKMCQTTIVMLAKQITIVLLAKQATLQKYLFHCTKVSTFNITRIVSTCNNSQQLE